MPINRLDINLPIDTEGDIPSPEFEALWYSLVQTVSPSSRTITATTNLSLGSGYLQTGTTYRVIIPFGFPNLSSATVTTGSASLIGSSTQTVTGVSVVYSDDGFINLDVTVGSSVGNTCQMRLNSGATLKLSS